MKKLGKVVFLFVLTSALLLCSCSLPYNSLSNKYDETDYVRGDGSASADIKEIKIHWISGDVKISYGDVTDIEFKESSEEVLKTDQKMRYLATDDLLTIQFCKSGLRIANNVEKTLYVILPLKYECSKLSVDVVSANVSLPAGFVCKNLTMDTVSGDLTSEGACTVETLGVDSVSGKVEMKLNEVSKVDIDTTSGDAKLYIPEEKGFKVEYDKVNGDFESDYNVLINGDTYKYGDASISITVDSVSGDLYIYKM